VVRREVLGVPQVYTMSDALWARIAPVVATVDVSLPRDARALLDAIIYQALTGSAWSALPACYPAPERVAACAERWRGLGVLERLAPLLLLRLDA
jgi:transposase